MIPLTYLPTSSLTHPQFIPIKATLLKWFFSKQDQFIPLPPILQSFAMSLKVENKVLTLAFKAPNELSAIPPWLHPLLLSSSLPDPSLITASWLSSKCASLTPTSEPPHPWPWPCFPQVLTWLFPIFTEMSSSPWDFSPSTQSKMQLPPLSSCSFPCHSPQH